MPKYLCLQRNTPPAAQPPPTKPSPAQMQAMYEQFNVWRETFSAQLVDLGGRLGAGRVAGPPADGPLIEVKELVGGYMIVAAESLDAAVAVALACPGLTRVEVIEIHTPG